MSVSPLSNSWIFFFKSTTKNYCFVLFWIYSTAPNIRISLTPPCLPNTSLWLYLNHSDLTVGHFSWSDGSAGFSDLLLSPARKKYVVESQEYVIDCTCTKALLKEYLLPYFIHCIQADSWNCHTRSSRGMVRCFYKNAKMKCVVQRTVSDENVSADGKLLLLVLLVYLFP